MVAYNFMARFAPAVSRGQKRQTIRGNGKRRPPFPGEQLQLYTGMRTKDCRLLRSATCRSVHLIAMELSSRRVRIQVGDVIGELTADQINQLAKDDGFATADDFFSYFSDTYGETFGGYLIKWFA